MRRLRCLLNRIAYRLETNGRGRWNGHCWWTDPTESGRVVCMDCGKVG